MLAVIVSTIVFAGLLTGCGTTKTGTVIEDLPRVRVSQQSPNYFVLDRQNTTLLRAFEDGSQRTVLQFADIETNPPELYNADGNHLRYRRIGSYAVVDGVISRLVVRQAGRLAMVNHPSLPVGYIDYPLLRNEQRLAVRLLDDPYANEPEAPRLFVRKISDAPTAVTSQRGTRDGDIVVRPLPRR